MNGGHVYPVVTRLIEMGAEAVELLRAVPEAERGLWWYRAMRCAGGLTRIDRAPNPDTRPTQGAL